MGISKSVSRAKKDYPLRFYQAIDAVKEGRYTLAEIYFRQAMLQHPGQHFWMNLLEMACSSGPAPIELVPNEERAEATTGDNVDLASAVFEPKEVTLPLDFNLHQLWLYCSMCCDIWLAYAMAGNQEAGTRWLAMSHCRAVSLFTMVMMHLLLRRREARQMKEFDAAMSSSLSDSKPANYPSEHVEIVLELLEQDMRRMWISSVVAYSFMSLECASQLPRSESVLMKKITSLVSYNCDEVDRLLIRVMKLRPNSFVGGVLINALKSHVEKPANEDADGPGKTHRTATQESTATWTFAMGTSSFSVAEYFTSQDTFGGKYRTVDALASMPIIFTMPDVLPVVLKVPLTMEHRWKRVIPYPHERVTLSYLLWAGCSSIPITPGGSAFLLKKSLYITSAQQTHITQNSARTADIQQRRMKAKRALKRMQNGAKDVLLPTPAEMQEGVGTSFCLTAAKECRVLCDEEHGLLALPIAMLQIEIAKIMGVSGTRDPCEELMEIVNGMYGMNSHQSQRLSGLVSAPKPRAKFKL